MVNIYFEIATYFYFFDCALVYNLLDVDVRESCVYIVKRRFTLFTIFHGHYSKCFTPTDMYYKGMHAEIYFSQNANYIRNSALRKA